MATLHRHLHRLAWLAVALAFGVIVFGAFVRLSNAGLSCPDWPTCYGRASWPTHAHEIAAANAQFERPVEVHKAWREQTHRILAGGLGVLVLLLALLAARRRRDGIASILGAAALIALSIPLYMRALYPWAGALAITGELLLLTSAARWSGDQARVATLALAMIVFQALLGMWTVTWLLKPVVVMGHLLGGLTTFALLTWLAWRSMPDGMLTLAGAFRLRVLLWIGLGLLAAQIALGGWTSANYAAWSCGTDFPKCLNQWWPAMDFKQAFVLARGVGVDYEGGVLDGPARVAIQMTHRLFALLVFGHLLGVGIRLLRTPGMRFWAVALLVLVCAQVALGISNVLFALPLPVAVLHNAAATLLLFVLVSLLARLREPDELQTLQESQELPTESA